MANWRMRIALESCIQVFISVRIKEEVGRCPACWVWRVPVLNCLCIKQLAGVISAISCILQPDGEIVFVEPLRNELGISACS